MTKNCLHKELDVQSDARCIFLPDNKALLAWSNAPQIVIWTLATWEKETELDGFLPTHVERFCSSDGRYLALNKRTDFHQIIWDRQAKKEVMNKDGRFYDLFCLVGDKAFGLKREAPLPKPGAATTVEYSELPVGNSKTFKLNGTFVLNAPGLSPNGELFAGIRAEKVVVWNFCREEIVGEFQMGSPFPPSMSVGYHGPKFLWAANGKSLAVAYGPTLYNYDIRTKLFAYLKTEATINHYALTQVGTQLAALDRERKHLCLAVER